MNQKPTKDKVLTSGIALFISVITGLVIFLVWNSRQSQDFPYLIFLLLSFLLLVILLVLFWKQTQTAKDREEQIKKINRLYFFISQISQMIVKAPDKETVFKEACRIAVETGKFRMAWIGLIDADTKQLLPVMHAGEELDYLSRINITIVGDKPEGRGPSGKALREGRYVFCNDIEKTPEMAPWKEAAMGRGYRSSISIPIKKFGKVIGAFTLYAPVINFFNATEITLLEEVTSDISFALEVFENEMMRRELEEEVIRVYKENETTLNRIKDSVVSVDNEWRYTFLNEAALTTHPLGKTETLGKIIWDIHPEMKGTVFWDKYHEAMRERKVVELENYYEPMDTWFSVKIYPSVDGLTIFYSDISQRKKAEVDIRRNEKKLDLIYNTTKDIFFLIAVEGNRYFFTSVNQTFLTATGLKKEQVVGKYIEEVIPATSLPIILKNYQAAINGKKRVEWEEESVYPAGNKFGIVSVTPVFDEHGVCNMLVGSLHDITELKNKENEILKEKNLSDSIINSLPGVFYLCSRQGKFLRWNKNFEKITMYSGEEIQQMHPLDFFSPEERELARQKMITTFTEGEGSLQADFLLKTNEKIPYYFTGKSIDYEGSECLMGVGIDFSERVKAQEKIRETTQQLRQLTAHLQKIREEERKRIGREIHDELGQQLTAIKMDISWIDKKIPEESILVKNKLKNLIGLLDGSNQSIRRILSELRPGLLDDHGLIEAIEWLGNQFTENSGVPVLFQSTNAEIKLSEPVATCIFRVYQEALTNIMRYAKAGKVETFFSSSGDIVKLTIEDNGCGFDPVAIQSNQSFGILGMKERVSSLNGTFEMQTAPGKGTKIVITIPYQ